MYQQYNNIDIKARHTADMNNLLRDMSNLNGIKNISLSYYHIGNVPNRMPERYQEHDVDSLVQQVKYIHK